MARKTCRKCGAELARQEFSSGKCLVSLSQCASKAKDRALRRKSKALGVAKRGLRLVRGQDRQQADIIAFNTLAEIRRAERAR